jgi:hypothetical protein
MPVDVKIIVTDAPPLITLEAAKSLNYLLYPALPIIIPDAVFFFEATNAGGKLGAGKFSIGTATTWTPCASNRPKRLPRRNWLHRPAGDHAI